MLKILDNASIKIKLTLMALLALVGFAIIVFSNYKFLQDASHELNDAQYIDLELVQISNDLQVGLVDLDRLFESAVMDNDKQTLETALKLGDELREKIIKIELLRSDYEIQSRQLMVRFNTFLSDAEQYTIDVIGGRFHGDEMFSSFSTVLDKRESYDQLLRELSVDINSSFQNTLISLRERSEQTIREQFILGAFLVVLVTFSFIWLIMVVTTAIGDVIKLSGEIAKGNLDVTMGRANSYEFKRLFYALSVMRDKLKEQYFDSETRTRRQHQITTLNEALRGELTVQQLGNNVLSCFGQELGVLVGALYVAEEDELLLTSSYAYTLRKGDRSRIQLGESMVGQAALEKALFVVRDLPENYAPVASGLGESVPKEVLLAPLLFNGRLLAVLELLSFKTFTEEDIEFVRRGSEGIAIALSSAISRVQLADALDQMRHQAEAMEQQQEELRATNEELEQQTSILRSSEESLQQQQEELRVMNEELEERNRLLDRQKEEIEKNNSALERSRSELQGKARQLELSSRYKSEFLSTMSHELRTPLNSILILSQGLMENKHENLEQKQIEHAEVIYSSGRDLLMLINDILDLSKVEEGKLELVSDSIEAESFSEKLQQQFQPQCESRDIDFKVDVELKSERTFICDEHRLNQILRNFISNALKFTPAGQVSVRIASPAQTYQTLTGQLTPENAIMFEVKDTGIGIPGDKLDLIFEAFQQVDGTISRKYGGTGLGLTISRKLAELMGGTVNVESAGKDQGALFRLILPLKPTTDSYDANRSSTDKTIDDWSDLGGFDESESVILDHQDDTVLIIEDDHNFSGVLFNLAEEFGFNAVCARTAAEAHQYLKTHIPGSIILDLGLPDAPGEQLLNHLKVHPKTKNIPVHVISGKPDINPADLAGAEEFIQKPFGRARMDKLFHDINAELKSLLLSKVLVIEDDKVQYEQLIRSFAGRNIECDIAVSSEEAMALLDKENYGAIILDLELPDGDGFSLAEQLSEKTLGKTPIIIYTARDLDKKQDAQLRRFAQRIVLKTDKSISRLMNETTLFLHWLQGSEKLKNSQQKKESLDVIETDFSEGKRLLLVDDDIRNLYSLSAVLEECGFEIQTASTGLEALSVLDSEAPFDLILMDVMMPEMDGLEAIQHIRKNPKLKNIPIIALTAKAMRDDRARCIDAGANDYMSKPVDSGKLKTIVRLWLGQA